MIADIRRSITVATLAVGLLVSVNCGGGFDFGGTWVGERKSIADPSADPVVAKVLTRIQVVIKPNLTFIFIDGGRPREGTLRLVDGHGEFEVQKYMGQPVQRESEEFRKIHQGFKLIPGKDSNHLTLDDSGAEQIILTRSEKPLESR